MRDSCTIAKLAAAAGVHVETIRYYQRRGLIPQPPRPVRGVRRYTAGDAEQLRFIKRAQAMGFTLTEVSNLLRLRSRSSCRETRDLAAAKLRVIDGRIRELRQLRMELAQLIAACDTNAQETHCPVIERLTVNATRATKTRQPAP